MINIDAQPQNADWLRTQRPDQNFRWRNEEDVRFWLAQQGMSVAAFKSTPMYQLNVKRLPFLRRL